MNIQDDNTLSNTIPPSFMYLGEQSEQRNVTVTGTAWQVE
jgi:hypothetical protein